jgi:hypothetical protein
MKVLLKLFPILLFSLALGFTSCNDDEDDNPITDDANLEGRVRVQNEFQQPLYDERSGILVFMEVGFQSFAVNADNVGNYVLSGAPTGTYTITASKEGFGTIVQEGIQISNVSPNYPVQEGNQVLPTITITKKPTTEFSDLALEVNSNQAEPPQYTLTITSEMNPGPPPTGQAKGFRIFIGQDETVGPENYIYQEHFASTEAAVEVIYENDWFESLDLEQGDAIFAAIYGDANFDQKLTLENDTVFPNITVNVGDISSVVLP